jgi:hypothetical protein
VKTGREYVEDYRGLVTVMEILKVLFFIVIESIYDSQCKDCKALHTS